MRDYVMDTFHQEEIGLNPLRGFVSPYARNIHPMFATLRYSHACLLLSFGSSNPISLPNPSPFSFSKAGIRPFLEIQPSPSLAKFLPRFAGLGSFNTFSNLQIKLMQLTYPVMYLQLYLCYSANINIKFIAVPQISSKTGKQ